MNSLDYAKKCCEEVMQLYPNGLIQPYGFHYHAGVFLHGMEEVYLLSGEKKYDEFILKWINHYVAPNGWIMSVQEMSVDSVMGTNHLIRYAKQRDDVPQFKIALKYTADKFFTWKTNKYGGFFHKGHTENQMWLDSVYMASLFLVRYGLFAEDNRYLGLAETQMQLLWEKARDSKTGLLYHAWDAGCEASWADKKTGCSPEFWGRAVGWYLATSSLMAEILPMGGFRDKMLRYATELAESILKFRDEETGLWYQVVDKTSRADNWIEFSCSCLFIYGICKLIRLGVFKDEKYTCIAKKAYESIIRDYIDFDGDAIVVKKTCVGTGVGNYEHYVARPTKDNDLHGMGAFILMATEYYKTFEQK